MPGSNDNTMKACFGAGCYWGTEKYFVKDFQKNKPDSILDAAVGFMGGTVENPSYRNVCGGQTGHVEVLDLKVDADKASFEDLVRFFFQFHDPTTLNRQGNDQGTQYASAIFYVDEEQKEIAEKVIAELDQLLESKSVPFKRAFEGNKVTTALLPYQTFYPAHEEHQQYLAKNPTGYCNHGIRFLWADI